MSSPSGRAPLVRRSTLLVRRSTLLVRRSTLLVRRSALLVRRSTHFGPPFQFAGPPFHHSGPPFHPLGLIFRRPGLGCSAHLGGRRARRVAVRSVMSVLVGPLDQKNLIRLIPVSKKALRKLSKEQWWLMLIICGGKSVA